MADDSSRSQREELSSASVSITPVPVEELDEDSPPPKGSIDREPADTGSASEPQRPRHVRKPRPSKNVARFLFGSERYVGEWRRHWIYVVGWSVLGIVSPFLVGYVIGLIGQANMAIVAIIFLVWLLLLGVVGWMVFEWWHERFVLTDKRVLLITGIISRKVAMMPLSRVTDMAYVQSPLGMMLNYGTFVIESAGQDQALREIKPLPHPNELYLLFCQELYDPDTLHKVTEGEDAA